MMRLFIAIELPKEVKDQVLGLDKHLQEFRLRFVRPEHMHITLVFLGEVENDAEIRSKLNTIRFKPFTLKTLGCGFFPTSKRIRVVWMGLERNDYFMKLQQDIRTVFNHKEKFMPHVTIARAREMIITNAHKLNEAMNKIEFKSIEFPVDKFMLYSSELTPQGPVHTVLQEYSAELDPA
jgi:2'-5' RNA ligase